MEKYQFTAQDFSKLHLELKLKGKLSINIASESMEPWLRKGAEVLMVSRPFQDLKPFDIVIFKKSDNLVCHVLYKCSEDQFITKGLRSPKFDEPNPKECLLGVVSRPQFNFFYKFILKREFDKLWEKNN